jgi:uncharacterized membrane protein YeiH
MILTIVFLCAGLIFLASAIIGGGLLRSRYLVHKKVYPSTPKYFWFLIGPAVVALILSAIVMQNWWYSLSVTFVITVVVGYAIIGQSLKPNKGQM